PPGQWALIRPVTRLPNDSLVTCVIKDGLPSAEGPTPLAQPFALTFQTAKPFHLTWGSKKGDDWYASLGAIIGFSNHLKLESVQSEFVTVEPPVEDISVGTNSTVVHIFGNFQAEQIYTITVKPGICDVYGQTLAECETIQICLNHEPSTLHFPSEYVLTLDPAGRLQLPVYTTNVEQCQVQVYSVKPEDWPAYTGLWKFLEQHPDDPLPTPPGKKGVETTLRPEVRPDLMVETPLDLSPAFPNQIGHAVVVIHGPLDFHQVEGFETFYSKVYLLWVQSTRLAAEILIQKPRSVAWVTSLESGQPIAGAQVTLYPGGIKALTTSTGLTRLPLIQPVEDQPNWTLVQKGPDSVLLPEGNEYWHLETGAEPKLR
ncbi:MAG TPA: hypothetical protein PKZ53_27840, partial [Acidobacteriota bacterium]|nr:hypothetical protein [Acidobacteriota bacterium]